MTNEPFRLSRALAPLAIAAFLIALTGCNTMEGAGKDIEKLGEEIQEQAD